MRKKLNSIFIGGKNLDNEKNYTCSTNYKFKRKFKVY